jgi:hypothetical protein
MGKNLDWYKCLQEAVEMHEQEINRIRDEMDVYWDSLTDEERKSLDA